MFSARTAAAMAKALGEPLRQSPGDVASMLNAVAMEFIGYSAFQQASPDHEFAAYARSIAAHAAALHQLLRGGESAQDGPYRFVATGALDALFYMGTPDDLQGINLSLIGLGEDLPNIAEQTAKGLWVLHRAASHAEEQWNLSSRDGSGSNRARPHISALVGRLAQVYAEAFGKTVPKRPHPDSPVTRFCGLGTRTMHVRLKRSWGLVSTNATADEDSLRELAVLTNAKVAEYLRRRQTPPGA